MKIKFSLFMTKEKSVCYMGLFTHFGVMSKFTTTVRLDIGFEFMGYRVWCY